MSDIPISKLERRMRPGEWSVGGFLGPHEKLMDVIREDDATLKRLGVTYEQIADKIEELLKSGIEGYRAYLNEELADPAVTVGHFTVKLTVYKGHQMCPWAFFDPSSKPPVYKPCMVGGVPRYSSRASDADFVITNKRTGEELKGPCLIVHLIRDHHFFEGKQSPYRVDPEKAARVLELIEE